MRASLMRRCIRGRPRVRPCSFRDRFVQRSVFTVGIDLPPKAASVMIENERVALALIALITGMMGFVESMAAVPAASTAMAADALSFVQHSISAGFSLWATAGTMTRQRWTIHMQGFVMAILGGLVCLIAVRRFFLGSI